MSRKQTCIMSTMGAYPRARDDALAPPISINESFTSDFNGSRARPVRSTLGNPTATLHVG